MTENVQNNHPTNNDFENRSDFHVQGNMGSGNENEREPPPVIERTQTEHLNKKLLCSFLNKLNEMSSEPTVNSENCNENEDDEGGFDD